MGRAAVWAAGGQRYGAMAGCAVVPAGAGGWPGLEQVLQLQRCRGWLRGLIFTHSCIALRTSLPRARAGVAASSAGSAASRATADLRTAATTEHEARSKTQSSCCLKHALHSQHSGVKNKPHLRLTACWGSSAVARTTTADRHRRGATAAAAAQGFRVVAAASCMVLALSTSGRGGCWSCRAQEA